MAKENYVYSAKLFIYGKKGNLLGGAMREYENETPIDFSKETELVRDILDYLTDCSGVPLSKIATNDLSIVPNHMEIMPGQCEDEEDNDEDEDEDEDEPTFHFIRSI